LFLVATRDGRYGAGASLLVMGFEYKIQLDPDKTTGPSAGKLGG